MTSSSWRGWMALLVLGCVLLVAPGQSLPQQSVLSPPTVPPQALCMDSTAALQNNAVAGEALRDSQRSFSITLLRQLAAKSKGNLFVSPHSIFQALLLAYFTAAGQTEESIKRVLQLPPSLDKLSTMVAYRAYHFEQLLRMTNETSYELRTANRLFIDKSQPIRDCLRGLFEGDELEGMDFASNPEKAREHINQWVEMATKGHIKDLVPADGVHQNTKLILANAAYFKGLWQSQFAPENTRKEVFHISPAEQTLVTMMKQKGSFNHKSSDQLGAHILELPYKGQDVSMYILLPPFVKAPGESTAPTGGVDGILAALTPDALRDLVDDQLMPRQVNVIIPKFKVEQNVELVEPLEALGIGDLFTPEANLTSLTGQPGISFDSIAHKAKIEVDEAGTKAAGATAIFSFRSSRPLTPVEFNCNHPFVYLLYDKTAQNVMFAGVYRSPRA